MEATEGSEAETPGASNFHSLPNGTSLRDAMKKLICKKFAARKGGKKAYDDVMDAWEEIPDGWWWMDHHSPVFILALMVHRQSPSIINAAAKPRLNKHERSSNLLVLKILHK